MKQKMVVSPNKKKETDLFIGSRKTSGQKNVWEDLNFLLPRSFIEELVRYKKDNFVTVTYTDNGAQMQCCDQCLKAHAIKTAIRMGFDDYWLARLQKAIPGEQGHGGYYLNKDDVITI